MPEAPPLAGLRVLEGAGSLAATYAGFLLSEIGAEVVKVETAGVARQTPGEHVLARGKRSIALDASGWRALLGHVDAVLTDDSVPPPDPDPDLVRCRVSAWGRTDSRLPPEESLLAAATGVQALQWSWSRCPVWLVTPMIGYMTGILAALGVSAAFFARHRGAPGQAVDVSGVCGALALNSGTFVSGAGHRGSLSLGGDPRGVYPTYGLYPTADGWLFVGALTQAFWTKLLTALDRLDLLAHPRLQGDPMTFFDANLRALVRAELEPVFATPSPAAWLEALRPAGVVDSFRPGVMGRLGIPGDRLAGLKPRLVHTSLTGHGSSGPFAALPGFDPLFHARSGLTAAQGGDDAPVLHMIAYNDCCAG